MSVSLTVSHLLLLFALVAADTTRTALTALIMAVTWGLWVSSLSFWLYGFYWGEDDEDASGDAAGRKESR